MVEKPLTILVYLALGVFVIVSPLLLRALRGRVSVPYISFIVLAAIALFVAKIDVGGNHRLAMSWVICAAVAAILPLPVGEVGRGYARPGEGLLPSSAAEPLTRSPQSGRSTSPARRGIIALGSLIGLAIASLTPWWRYNGHYIDATRHDLTNCALITLAILIPLLREIPATTAPIIKWQKALLLAFIPFILYLSFTTGMAENWQTFGSWWHHWGAYVGPVELLLSGAHVLKDFPVQYGLGPTLLIAGACENDCWVGMYYVVGIATALWAWLTLYTATTLGVRSRAALIALLPVAVCACFFWTSYGSAFSSPILFPSVAGLRFTPVGALVAALCFCEGRGARYKLWGHGLWAVGALWSPETLYLVSFVWWPYYCWRQVAALEWRRMPFALVKAIAELVGVLLVVLVGFLAIYFLCYRALPSFTAWFAYLLFPPAFIAMNPKGLIWWYGAVLLIGFMTVARIYRSDGDTPIFRKNLLVLLMGYAALSYCMGRSLDNNFANLAPYALLILVGALASAPFTLRAVSAAMLASLVGLLPLFGWGIWKDDYQAGRLLEFAPEKVTHSFAFTDPASAEKLRQTFAAQKLDVGDPADAARAIETISKMGEQVTVLDHASVVVEGGPRNVWDGFHSAVIYAYLPQEWRTKFLIATAQRLQRSGWVIAEKKFDAAPWLESYKAAYDLAGEEDYGTYHAYHFVPKTAR